MISEQHIIQKLKIIDQYNFESMIDSLLHQGAFPEIVNQNASLQPYGVNMENRRTRKSFPRADTELITHSLKVESSVQVNWKSKFKEVIENNKGQSIEKFVFCTNQDIHSAEINIDGKNIKAEEYGRNNLNCKNCFVIDKQSLILILQNPAFFHIRRNFLDIPEDFFCSVEGYKRILQQNSSLALESNFPQSKIRRYANILSDKLIFEPKQIILLHNDDYLALLHSIAEWASGQVKKDSPNTLSQELCFIRWPQNGINLENIITSEINEKIATIVFIWGAHEIQTLSEYLMLNKKNVMLVLVCKSAFKDRVYDKLGSFGGSISIQDLFISEIDNREVSTKEHEMHQHKIDTLVESLKEYIKKCEALIYFYSPFYPDDSKLKNKIGSILKINQAQLDQLFILLKQNNLASKTGGILWLKQPIIAKKLLNDYINDGTFNIEEMVI